MLTLNLRKSPPLTRACNQTTSSPPKLPLSLSLSNFHFHISSLHIICQTLSITPHHIFFLTTHSYSSILNPHSLLNGLSPSHVFHKPKASCLTLPTPDVLSQHVFLEGLAERFKYKGQWCRAEFQVLHLQFHGVFKF